MKKIIIAFILIVSLFISASYIPVNIEKGKINLSSEYTTVTDTINVYRQALGTFADGTLNGFTLATDGTLTYTGLGGTFLVIGISDVQVDKACETTYGLYLNDVLVSGEETPHTFLSASKTANISITAIVTLSTNDELTVWVKSNTIDTNVLIKTLRVVFWGEK